MRGKVTSIMTQPGFLTGIYFTAAIAAVGTLLSMLPFMQSIGPLALSILLAVSFRHFYGYPEKWKSGIAFSGKTILRLAIVLYGFKLNITLIFQEGPTLLVQSSVTIVFSIGMMVLLSRWLKTDPMITLLLGIGTGICGAAAIAAAAPIVRANEEDTAMSVGIIAGFGTIVSLLYTLVYPYIEMPAHAYGIWSGLTLHEIAHVALAGSIAGEEGLAAALMAKLSRVLLLIPVCFLLVVWMKKRTADDSIASSATFPLFLIGFLVCSLIGTAGMELGWLSNDRISGIAGVGTFLLTMAMASLGLTVNLRQIKNKALKPLAALAITSLLLSLGWAIIYM